MFVSALDFYCLPENLASTWVHCIILKIMTEYKYLIIASEKDVTEIRLKENKTAFRIN